MGSEDLFHKKRKTARVNSESGKSERSKRSRNSGDYVLIVCEDSKATPNYLKAVLDDLKLSTANIQIVGKECGSAPMSVVEYAKELKKQTKYDRIYCVIDRDQHDCFLAAINMAKGNGFQVIISVPCFEYWLLLHFEYTSSPFQNAQVHQNEQKTGSLCDRVISQLKKYMPEYKKGNFFNKVSYNAILKPREDSAIHNAKQRTGELGGVANIYAENPYTNMHELIEYLRNLKASNTH